MRAVQEQSIVRKGGLLAKESQSNQSGLRGRVEGSQVHFASILVIASLSTHTSKLTKNPLRAQDIARPFSSLSSKTSLHRETA